jgi:hypothetical protein
MGNKMRDKMNPFGVKHGTNNGTDIFVRYHESETNFVEYKLRAGLNRVFQTHPYILDELKKVFDKNPMFIEQWTQFPNDAYKKMVIGAGDRLVECANAMDGIVDPEDWRKTMEDALEAVIAAGSLAEAIEIVQKAKAQQVIKRLNRGV